MALLRQGIIWVTLKFLGQCERAHDQLMSQQPLDRCKQSDIIETENKVVMEVFGIIEIG